ncbi:conjugative transfer relaxase/helicase TraI domain-containing protein [Providencia stuartii]|uniref:conjugative transfer relaxase/helicase TraI domain-containing protein n=1 Tax=Providencia stuartii TaxID=588 RepID=UPI0011232C3A|nr:conjugative transfer relaxase/helicase TraI domain-containing protein [Providencia stuartii]
MNTGINPRYPTVNGLLRVNPTPSAAWPVFDAHGKAQGMMLYDILRSDEGHLQGLAAKGRLLGSDQAQLMVFKGSQKRVIAC